MDKIAALWATAVVVGIILAFLALTVGLMYYRTQTVIALMSTVPLGMLCVVWQEAYVEFRWRRRNK